MKGVEGGGTVAGKGKYEDEQGPNGKSLVQSVDEGR